MTDNKRARGTADVLTAEASLYLQQLCKHFAHKVPAVFDATSGEVSFPYGRCSLKATDGVLRIAAEAPDAEQLAKVQDVIARHLVRFAFREQLAIEWRGD